MLKCTAKGYTHSTMTRYIDAHCHMGASTDFNSVIHKNAACGVVGYICNSVTFHDWADIARMGIRPEIYPCIGIHPWHINVAPDNWAVQMRKILQDNPGLMVGEIGLDKHYPEMGAQIEFFKTQLEYAAEFGRVAHVHCVGAWDKIGHILKSCRNLPPAIVAHGFAGPADIIDRMADQYNIYFSYSPAVLNPRRRRVRECIAKTPQGRILTESDGNISDSHKIVSVVAEISRIRGTDMSDAIYNNTMEIIKNG